MAVIQNDRFAVPTQAGSCLPGGAPSLIRDAANDRYLLYTKGNLYESKDLIEWNRAGEVSHTIPKAVCDFLGETLTDSPDAAAFPTRAETRLYGSAENEAGDSCIYVSAAAAPEQPYKGRLTVLYSKAGEPRAVCPSVVADKKEGFGQEHYLVYGAGESGIRILHLNPRNGLAHVTGFGKVVARRPRWLGFSVWAASAIYNPETEYYYLFYTTGCGKDAQIRVGRSKEVDGPYMDAAGHDLADIDDYAADRGTIVLSGYRFDESQGWCAFSHPSVIRTEAGFFMAHEAQVFGSAKAKNEPVTQIRKILFTPDGWPLVSPEIYAGETEQQISLADLVGHYEFIKFKPEASNGVRIPVALDFLTPAMQGVSSTRNDWAYVIPENEMGRVELGGSMRGSWKYLNNGCVELTYATYRETYRITPVWDAELNEASFALVGLDTFGRTVWAKKADLPKSPF